MLPPYSPSYIPNYGHRKQYLPPRDYKMDLHHNDSSMNTHTPWSKLSVPVSEHSWNFTHKCTNSGSTEASENKDNSKIAAKKKTLMIIDPATGENILDTISPPPSQDTISSNDNASDPESQVLQASCGEADKDFSNVTSAESTSTEQQVSFGDEFAYLSDTIKKCDEDKEDFDYFECFSDDLFEEAQKDSCASKEVTAENEETTPEAPVSETDTQNDATCENCSNTLEILVEEESEKIATNDGESGDSLEVNNRRSETHPFNLGSKGKKGSDQTTMETEISELRRKHILLQERAHLIKQERQKLAILQSFLRYKKHQLDDSFRNLEDFKIEMANWECSLVDKAKRLQEREMWLDSKRAGLSYREKLLDEREKSLKMHAENSEATEDYSSRGLDGKTRREYRGKSFGVEGLVYKEKLLEERVGSEKVLLETSDNEECSRSSESKMRREQACKGKSFGSDSLVYREKLLDDREKFLKIHPESDSKNSDSEGSGLDSEVKFRREGKGKSFHDKAERKLAFLSRVKVSDEMPEVKRRDETLDGASSDDVVNETMEKSMFSKKHHSFDREVRKTSTGCQTHGKCSKGTMMVVEHRQKDGSLISTAENGYLKSDSKFFEKNETCSCGEVMWRPRKDETPLMNL